MLLKPACWVQIARQVPEALPSGADSYADLNEETSMEGLQEAFRKIMEFAMDHFADEYLLTLPGLVLRAKPDRATQEAVQKIKAKMRKFRALPLAVKLEAWK
jgi:hypothetical protein